jgi:hypothetical protein
MKRSSAHLFAGSFVAAVSVSLVATAEAVEWKSYSPIICQVDNDNATTGYLTNGALQNRDSVSHHYYCPMLEDELVDLSQGGNSLTVCATANSYDPTSSVEVRSCRVPSGGSSTTCGAYYSNSGSFECMSVDVSAAWQGGAVEDSYYVDVILDPEDTSDVYNTVYSIYTTT